MSSIPVENKVEKVEKVEYKKLDPISHVLERPDMYVGGPLQVQPHAVSDWIVKEDNKVQFSSQLSLSMALVRILVEPLSNIMDNVWRSSVHQKEVTKIKVSKVSKVSKKSKNDKNDKNENPMNGIEFWNDGLWIPVRKHEQYPDLYIPEIIFGHLLTSSNYDDKDNRFSSGRNGLGIKLCNILSTQFEIECVDPEEGLMYHQTWTGNMRKKSNPVLKPWKSKSATGYVCIRMFPDYDLFGGDPQQLQSLDNHHLSILKRLVMEMALCVAVPVHWEWETDKIKWRFKNVLEYVREQIDGMVDSKKEIFHTTIPLPQQQSLEVVVGTFSNDKSTSSSRVLSFVNGVCTNQGGQHVDVIYQELNKACAVLKIPMKEVRQKLLVVVKAQLYNPQFNNQAKDKMVRPLVSLSKEESESLQNKFVSAMKKWESLSQFISEWKKMQEQMQLKTMEKKKSGVKQCLIEGLDPAILASTAKSSECTLILCEGLSAKTFAVQGIHQVGWGEKKGRMYFGVYPLRGKCLNVRNASSSTLSQNREITDIFNALNLKHQMDYSVDKNFETLSYGRIMILTDADSDGTHIAGLLLNMMDCVAPSLLKRNPSFVYWMKTPIAKIWLARQQVLTFYSDEEYWKYLEEHNRSEMKKVKYFKGLGACSDVEVRDTFGAKVLGFDYDEQCKNHLVKVFDQKKSGERKQWLCDYMNSNSMKPEEEEEKEKEEENEKEEKDEKYAITEFVNKDLIKFSWEDCERNLPHVMDGLKVSQRKILYAIFKKKLHKRESPVMKVAQLAGYVAEVSNYHHGEQCLVDTICRLTHSFVGGLNIPFLERDGQFGSRSHLGKDAASGRYLFTKGDTILPFLFRSEDEDLLDYAKEDGEIVQPEYYAPVIPLLLVNGCSTAIGTGWSCTIPPHHPLEVIQCIRLWLENIVENKSNNTLSSLSSLPSFQPFYRNFKGTIHPSVEKKYVLTGKVVPFDPSTSTSLVKEKKEKSKEKSKKNQKEKEEKEEKLSHPPIPSLKGVRATSRIYVVTEIPVSCSLHRYKEYLDTLVEKKRIRKYENHSTSNEPLFVIFLLSSVESGGEEKEEDSERLTTKEMEMLKLSETLSEENMVVLVHPTTQEESNLTLKSTKVYKMTKGELMEKYCVRRLELYEKRKQKMMETLQSQITLYKEKIRFLEEIVLEEKENKNFWKLEETEMESYLQQKQFIIFMEDPHYHYLKDIPIKHCTLKQKEKWEKEKSEWEKEYEKLVKKQVSELWKDDLKELESRLQQIYPELL
jgi:DNA topoisomerase-2